MPIYEYRCTACKNLFEEWTKSFDSPEHEPCPKCGGDATRVISRTSFVLEGSGWYATEYGNRKSDHESGAGAPEAESPKDTGSTETTKTSDDSTASSTSDTAAKTEPGTTGGSSETSATAAGKTSATSAPASETAAT